MLDNINIMKVGGNTININAVSGTLIKSTEKSKIVRFHSDSRLAGWMFDQNQPRRIESTYEANREGKNIIILQTMLCSGEYFLVEYLDVVKAD